MTRFLLFLLSVTGVLTAQPRDMFPWWETPIVRDLNLSEDQTKQIQSIVRENRDRLVDLRGAVEKADHAVEDQMNEDKPELGKFTAALDRQTTARAELAKTFSLMGFKMRMVLTQQQWRELQKRRAQRPMNQPPAKVGPGPRGPQGGVPGGVGIGVPGGFPGGPQDGGPQGPPNGPRRTAPAPARQQPPPLEENDGSELPL